MKKITLLLISILATLIVFSQTIKINEFMASNATTIADDYGEYDDWIELFNYGSDTVNVAGYYITDKFDNTTKHQIPTGFNVTKIPPGGFLLLWADNDTLQDGPTHLKFKLSATGEHIGVYAPDGSTCLDSISFGNQATDISYGRYPNGNNNWQHFLYPTPGASNSLVNIQEVNTSGAFSIYPNPSQNNEVSFSKPVSFRLYSYNGQEIGYFEHVQKLNTGNLTNGIYFIVLDDGNNAKIIVSNN